MDVVFIDIFGAAARLLGGYWEDDVCSFTDVTIGVSRLQQLVREFAPEREDRVPVRKKAPRALLVTMPGDQHNFGLAIVQDLYRRAGWHVSGGFCSTAEQIIEEARADRFDVVGLSVSKDASLDTLTSLIKVLRKTRRDGPLRILVGGPYFLRNPANAARVGADATAPDGRQAVPKLSSLLDTIPMRY
jgi:methylmalonyl-CoA mutase cobalamin-binding domain/chain